MTVSSLVVVNLQLKTIFLFRLRTAGFTVTAGLLLYFIPHPAAQLLAPDGSILILF
jgi:hypothetical protein